jgi:hypothetical protein
MDILLVNIGGYFMTIILVAIGDYSIDGYWWLFYDYYISG